MNDARLAQILGHAKTIAVLGIHPDPSRPANYVPAYLFEQGYRILGVNPVLVGTELFGQPVVATLADLHEPVDLVDVFRRADALPAHQAELLATSAPVIWFQSGIFNDLVAEVLAAGGKEVVQDRCTLADHQRLGLPHVEAR